MHVLDQALLLAVRGAGLHPDGHGHLETSSNHCLNVIQQVLFLAFSQEINPQGVKVQI